MARRTIGFHEVTATRKYRPDEGRILFDEVGPSGMLGVVTDWASQGRDLTDTSKQIHTSVTRVRELSSAVLFEVATGSWGDGSRRLVDSTGARPSRQIDPDDSATVGTRAVLLVPPSGEKALYFSEREGIHVGGSRAWESIRAEVSQYKVNDRFHQPRQVLLDRAPVTMEEEWLKGVELEQVTVNRTRPSLLPGGPADATPLRVKQTIRPTGKTRFSPRILTSIRSSSTLEEAAGVVRLEGPDEIDTVELTVTDGELSKTYEIDSPSTPALRELLNDHGQPVLQDPAFLDACGDLAERYYRRIGEAFDHGWLR